MAEVLSRTAETGRQVAKKAGAKKAAKRPRSQSATKKVGGEEVRTEEASAPRSRRPRRRRRRRPPAKKTGAKKAAAKKVAPRASSSPGTRKDVPVSPSAGPRNGLSPARQRLDRVLVDRGLADSRPAAADLVERGLVLVAGAVADKPARLVAPSDPVELQAGPPRFVSRGGEKLQAALDRFDIDVTGCRVLDVGASTGGFTDCLLQAGARRVVALDVGHGQLHERLRRDAPWCEASSAPTSVRRPRPTSRGARSTPPPWTSPSSP